MKKTPQKKERHCSKGDGNFFLLNLLQLDPARKNPKKKERHCSKGDGNFFLLNLLQLDPARKKTQKKLKLEKRQKNAPQKNLKI